MGASVYNPMKGGKVMQDVQAGDICLMNGTDAYDAYKADPASIQAGGVTLRNKFLCYIAHIITTIFPSAL